MKGAVSLSVLPVTYPSKRNAPLRSDHRGAADIGAPESAVCGRFELSPGKLEKNPRFPDRDVCVCDVRRWSQAHFGLEKKREASFQLVRSGSRFFNSQTATSREAS